MQLPAAARLQVDQRYVRARDDLTVVGKGSFGTAYLAVDRLTARTVVVKRQPANGPRVGRELAAFRFLQAFKHPNVLEMLDTFEHNHYINFVFEVASMDLWTAWTTPIGRTGLLEASRLRGYVHDALAGVAHLHD